jgi:thiamine-monophosphate kinase
VSASPASPDAGGPSVGGTGERQLLARLRAQLPPAPAHVSIGIGDDAAVVEPPRGELEVVTTDTLVEGVHFERRFCDAGDIGRKALAVSVSDLAAMGAMPRIALLSLALPDTLPLAAFDRFVAGFVAAAAEYRVALVGGNLTRSPGPWMIDVTVIGNARRRRVLTRTGGRPGDELFVTGHLGAARAGLAALRAPSSDDHASRPAALADAIARYCCPEPRVRAGVRVARARAATACMDLSDGLADAATQVAEASESGVEIDLAAVPVHPAATLLWAGDAAWQALLGGDDYELLFAVPARRRRAFFAAISPGTGVPVTRIGRLTDKTVGACVRLLGGTTAPLPRGYDHFV